MLAFPFSESEGEPSRWNALWTLLVLLSTQRLIEPLGEPEWEPTLTLGPLLLAMELASGARKLPIANIGSPGKLANGFLRGSQATRSGENHRINPVIYGGSGWT